MYILEGNIGAGKSTLKKLVEQHLPHVVIAYEPLQNWQSQVYGQSLLANFYQHTQRWAYTLETLTMVARVREHLTEQHFLERVIILNLQKLPNRLLDYSVVVSTKRFY